MMTKKIILLCSCFCLLAATAFAQGTTPAVVQNSFNAKYPNVEVKDWDWEDDEDMYEADFKMNNKEYEAYFRPDGQWLMTKRELKKDELPASVSSSVSEGQYSSWKIDDRYEIDSPEGKAYKVKVEQGNQTMYLKFNQNGQLIESKEEKKIEKR